MSRLQKNLGEILNEKTTKIIPENIKQGVTIFDVTGTYEGTGGGDVKLFETIEEMQQDPNPQDGDLAIVYKNNMAHFSENTETQIVIFPKTVVFSSAIEDDINGEFMAADETTGYFNGRFQLDTYMKEVEFSAYSSASSINITYTSNDNITFTRDDNIAGNRVIDFGLVIKYGSEWGIEEFDENIGFFMLVDDTVFEGLFKYSNSDSEYVIADTPFTLLSSNQLLPNVVALGKNGPVTGSDAIYNNLDMVKVYEKIYGPMERNTTSGMVLPTLYNNNKTLFTVLDTTNSGTRYIKETSLATTNKMIFNVTKSITYKSNNRQFIDDISQQVLYTLPEDADRNGVAIKFLNLDEVVAVRYALYQANKGIAVFYINFKTNTVKNITISSSTYFRPLSQYGEITNTVVKYDENNIYLALGEYSGTSFGSFTYYKVYKYDIQNNTINLVFSLQNSSASAGYKYLFNTNLYNLFLTEYYNTGHYIYKYDFSQNTFVKMNSSVAMLPSIDYSNMYEDNNYIYINCMYRINKSTYTLEKASTSELYTYYPKYYNGVYYNTDTSTSTSSDNIVIFENNTSKTYLMLNDINTTKLGISGIRTIRKNNNCYIICTSYATNNVQEAKVIPYVELNAYEPECISLIPASVSTFNNNRQFHIISDIDEEYNTNLELTQEILGTTLL